MAFLSREQKPTYPAWTAPAETSGGNDLAALPAGTESGRSRQRFYKVKF